MKHFLPSLGLALFASLYPLSSFACPAHNQDHKTSSNHMESHDAMHQAMEESTGDADIDFARAMIPHHQMAIDMAQEELKNGTDPTLRQMAQDIIKAQDQEIAQMDDWLEKYDR